jgi:pimeloyl-ACP methyl ester carboxylesterase
MSTTDTSKYGPKGFIKTSDDVKLSYIQAGPASGPKLLLVPGWSQTAAQWEKQIDYFSQSYNVVAYDHRGHGESEKPSHGYRISRLAADLHDLITQLDMKDVTIMGHSMGSSVIWCYWDLFADSRKRVSKLVLVDQASYMTADPSWPPERAASISAIFAPSTARELGNGMCGPDGRVATTALLKSMFTAAVSTDDFDWTVGQNLKMSPEHAATLLIDHANNDWRDVLPRIDVPTLLVAAKGSLFNADGIRWIATQIPGAECRIFEVEELGSHFMFWENPKLFNGVVDDFLRGVGR